MTRDWLVIEIEVVGHGRRAGHRNECKPEHDSGDERRRPAPQMQPAAQRSITAARCERAQARRRAKAFLCHVRALLRYRFARGGSFATPLQYHHRTTNHAIVIGSPQRRGDTLLSFCIYVTFSWKPARKKMPGRVAGRAVAPALRAGRGRNCLGAGTHRPARYWVLDIPPPCIDRRAAMRSRPALIASRATVFCSGVKLA